MPLEKACLIASGVNTEKNMQTYLAKIHTIMQHIEQETKVTKTNDPLEKSTIIFNWLQEHANEGVYNDCYDLRDTLNLKVGNCLSYAIRFTVVCRNFGIDIKNIFIPGHIYNMVVSNGTAHYFEHTHSDGVVKNVDKYHPQKKIMKDKELIAEIYLYKARNTNSGLKFDESIVLCQRALLCNPDDSRPIILLLDNYIAKKEYQEAFQALNDYLARHPDDKKSFKKTYILLKRLCEKGNNSSSQSTRSSQNNL